MRTMTAQQQRLLGLTNRSYFTLVEVYSTAKSAWVSLNNLFGLNFVQSVQWTDDVNNNGASATVTLFRNVYNYNLAPLVANTKTALVGGVVIDLAVPIRISVAVMPNGLTPSSSDYFQVFYGRIYETDWADTTFTVQAQDWLGQLLSVWMEPPAQVYAALNGTLAESIMQSILNYANGLQTLTLGTLYSVNGTGGTPFQAGDSPGWAIVQYTQPQMATFTALDNISQQIGWVLRQKWNNSIGGWALTWYDPLRGNNTPTWTFAMQQYLAVNTCGVHLGGIRNAVAVCWNDPSGYPHVNNDAGMVTDATSITKYGRQFVQIGTESTTQISNSTQAMAMANNALSDLAQPLVDFVVEVPLFPFAELNDVYTFKADGYHFDSDQTLSVINYQHQITNNQVGTTTLAVRGKPTAGTLKWLQNGYTGVTRMYGAMNLDTRSEIAGNLSPNGSLGSFSRF